MTSETVSTPAITVQALLRDLDRLADQANRAMNAGDFAAAEGDWTQVLDRLPENPAGWSNRGNVRLSQNQIQAAIADYTQAIQLAPQIPDAYVNRGIALEAKGDWQGAIAVRRTISSLT